MFNGNTSNWDVSRVVDMTSMFEGARVQQEPQSMERSRRYVRQHAERRELVQRGPQAHRASRDVTGREQRREHDRDVS